MAELWALFQLPLASNADLELLASMTEGFSGADLKAILTDAGLEAAKEAVRRQPGDGSGDIPQELPLITRGTLMYVASEARPSTSEEDRRSLREMFSQFSTSRKSSISTEVPLSFCASMAFSCGLVDSCYFCYSACCCTKMRFICVIAEEKGSKWPGPESSCSRVMTIGSCELSLVNWYRRSLVYPPAGRPATPSHPE